MTGSDDAAWSTRTYRPMRAIALLILVFGLFFIGFGLWMPLASTMPDDRMWLTVLLGAFTLLAFGTAAYMYTWTLTVSAEQISSSSLFATRRVPLENVVAVTSRMVNGKNGSCEQTTVIGAGQQVSFTERTPDYGAIKDYVYRRAGEQAAERGRALQPGIKRRDQQLQLRAIAAILFLSVGYLGLYFRHGAQYMLDRQHALDARGAKVHGRVTGAHIAGSKSRTYLLDYEYNLNGQVFEHSSPVTYADYSAAVPGQPVTITYLPDNPDIARAAQSIGERSAQQTAAIATYLLWGAVLIPGGLVVASLKGPGRSGMPAA